MAHYVGVFMPLETGGWRAVFPDIPHLNVDEPHLDLAVLRAAATLNEINQNGAGPLPPPRDLKEIKEDDAWASAYGVDWHTCVVTMLPLRG